MKKGLILCLIVLLLFTGCNVNNESVNNEISDDVNNDVVNNDEAVVEEEVVEAERGKIIITSLEDIDQAIDMMTLEEKAGQMIQAERGGIQLSEIAQYNIGSVLSGGGSVPSKNTPEGWITLYNRMQKVSRNSSSGLPLIYGIDAVHGHNNVENAVIFPHNIGLGAANNPELMYEIGVAVAKDIAATGLNWNFAPAVSIVQDLRWGRTYEGFAETTDRVSVLGSEYLKGLESEGIISTTKHYIGDGFTTLGTGEGSNLIDRGDVTVPMAELLDLYLPAYEEAIKAGTKTIMASYNSVDGLKMHEHKELLTDVLRDQLGFEGLVISDWEAIHAINGTLEQQVAASINSGIDMLMQPYNWKDVYKAIIKNVENNNISEERIDEAVRRILVLKWQAGLFTDDFEKTVGDFATQENKTLARTAVSESMVLLKNNEILPLKKDMKVYLTGPASDHVGVQSGGWTLSWQGEMNPDLNNGVSLRDAFEAELSKNGGILVDSQAEADVIVLAIGEQPYAEMQGDSASLELTGAKALEANVSAVEAVQDAQVPVVTVIIAGRPLIIDEYLDDWDALVMAWLPGTEGFGMTDVLFGDKAFTGTLPVTWPKTNEQASDSVIMEDYDAQNHQFKYGFGLKY